MSIVIEQVHGRVEAPAESSPEGQRPDGAGPKQPEPEAMRQLLGRLERLERRQRRLRVD